MLKSKNHDKLLIDLSIDTPRDYGQVDQTPPIENNLHNLFVNKLNYINDLEKEVFDLKAEIN